MRSTTVGRFRRCGAAVLCAARTERRAPPKLGARSRMFELQFLSVSRFGKCGESFVNVHRRKFYFLDVAFADAETRGFPQMMNSAQREPENLRADDVRRERVRARDAQAALDRLPANRPDADHRGMADGD